jgi:acetoin utilization deacetylase AcuC-like enzyme
LKDDLNIAPDVTQFIPVKLGQINLAFVRILSGGQGDEEYREIFQNVLLPAADNFQPDFIVISAGFDAHRDDPLASMALTEQGYADMTRIVSTIATRYANGRIISCLEGGYHLKALAESVEQHLLALLDS